MSGLAIYGNHCGPGHGTPEEPAIDAVDQACKDHDADYARDGYFNEGADERLIQRLEDLMNSGTLNTKQTIAAEAVQTTFEVIDGIRDAGQALADNHPHPEIPRLADGSEDRGSAEWAVNNGQLDPDYRIREDEFDTWYMPPDGSSSGKMEYYA
jgi:hypothetical protein